MLNQTLLEQIKPVKEGKSLELLQMHDITLDKKLGAGAFGEVWRGKHGSSDVAIKILQKITEEAMSQTMDELTLLG